MDKEKKGVDHLGQIIVVRSVENMRATVIVKMEIPNTNSDSREEQCF